MKPDEKIKLYFHSFDSGFCRTYFKNKETRAIYCVQYGVRISDPADLFICSDDGEPSHRVRTDNKLIERPPLGSKDSDIVNAFIDRIEKDGQ